MSYFLTQFTSISFILIIIKSQFFKIANSSSIDHPVFIPAPLQINASIGSEVTLPCRLRNMGSFKITWLKMDHGSNILTYDTSRIIDDYRYRILSDYKYNEITKETVTVRDLQVKNIKADDVGIYVCQVNTPKFSHSIISNNQEINLSVLLSPQFVDAETTKDISAISVNDNVKIECTATGVPQPKVSWFLQLTEPNKSIQIKQSGNYGEKISIEIENENSMTITNIQPKLIRSVECRANNNVEPSISRQIFLTVKYPPKIDVQQVTSSNSQLQSFRCLVDAYPQSKVSQFKTESVWFNIDEECLNNLNLIKLNSMMDELSNGNAFQIFSLNTIVDNREEMKKRFLYNLLNRCSLSDITTNRNLSLPPFDCEKDEQRTFRYKNENCHTMYLCLGENSEGISGKFLLLSNDKIKETTKRNGDLLTTSKDISKVDKTFMDVNENLFDTNSLHHLHQLRRRRRQKILNSFLRHKSRESDSDNFMLKSSDIFSSNAALQSAKKKNYDQHGFFYPLCSDKSVSNIDCRMPDENFVNMTAVNDSITGEWKKIVKKFDKTVIEDYDRLTELINNGIPHDMRAEVWELLLNVKNVVFPKQRALSQKTIEQIGIDLCRTPQTHKFFTEGRRLDANSNLDKILRNISALVPTGYSQAYLHICYHLYIIFRGDGPRIVRFFYKLYHSRFSLHRTTEENILYFVIPNYLYMRTFMRNEDTLFEGGLSKGQEVIDGLACNNFHYPTLYRLWDRYFQRGLIVFYEEMEHRYKLSLETTIHYVRVYQQISSEHRHKIYPNEYFNNIKKLNLPQHVAYFYSLLLSFHLS
ncbi:hypothetical protein SNEBB_007198 [Seison nebaliae]|nr:hypothetical protein SNEBB_007198 [Seison nebaliae]